MKSDKERIRVLEHKVEMLIRVLEDEGIFIFLDCNDCKNGYWQDGDTCAECQGTGIRH